MQFDAAILIGLGGTGSIIMEPLMRVLAYHKDGCNKLILCDGDIYESKNHERQMGTIVGENKATATKAKHKATAVDLGVELITIKDYISRLNFDEILDGLPKVKRLLVVTAVDNFASRREIIKVLIARPGLNFVLVDPGNELDYGEVTTSIWHDGQWFGPDPLLKHPNVASAGDEIPTRGGCEEQAKSDTQLLVTNFWAAGLALAVIQALLDGQPYCDDTKFNIRQFKSAPFGSLLDPIHLETIKVSLQRSRKETTKATIPRKNAVRANVESIVSQVMRQVNQQANLETEFIQG